MDSTRSNWARAKTILSAVGSIAATAMVVRGITQDFLPYELQDYIFSGIRNSLSKFSNELTMVIDDCDGLVNNEIYDAAEIYLGPKVTLDTRRLKVSKPEKEKHFKITMENNEEIIDVFHGEKFKWVWVCRKIESKNFNYTEERFFELTFHRKNKDLVMDSYFPYITNEAKNKQHENKTIKIFTVEYGRTWTPINLDHPATFDTLAMDTEQKELILNDIMRFVQRRDYYRKVGKAWKRGYLLYGPPGTGKSSLIAAMANHLNFDIYDLELSELRNNSDLRRLLVSTANKSILVVEDIDCTIALQDRQDNGSRACDQESEVTLSGFLNFVDGLWSSCGDERIIIFTTNHLEKLDPALLRPGRMDMHINMSYCTPCGFKILASNYHGIKDHALFKQIEDSIRIAKVTPAQVAEQLLKNDDPDVALQELIDFIHLKIKENKVEEAKKSKQESARIDNKENVGQEKEIEDEHAELHHPANCGTRGLPKGARGGRRAVRQPF